jgi:hypothetical protein
MNSTEEIKQENRKIRALRILTDLTIQRLCIERMTIVEAREAVQDLRRAATNMFPGKGGVFDLVIAPRLDRVIRERFGCTALVLN